MFSGCGDKFFSPVNLNFSLLKIIFSQLIISYLLKNLLKMILSWVSFSIQKSEHIGESQRVKGVSSQAPLISPPNENPTLHYFLLQLLIQLQRELVV